MGRNDKKEKKQSKLNKLVSENERLKKEVRELLDVVESLNKQVAELENDEDKYINLDGRKGKKGKISEDVSFEGKCPECGKGILKKLELYKRNIPVIFLSCPLCGYRKKGRDE